MLLLKVGYNYLKMKITFVCTNGRHERFYVKNILRFECGHERISLRPERIDSTIQSAYVDPLKGLMKRLDLNSTCHTASFALTGLRAKGRV